MSHFHLELILQGTYLSYQKGFVEPGAVEQCPQVHSYPKCLWNMVRRVICRVCGSEGHPESWCRMVADSEKGSRELNLSSYKPFNDIQTLTLSDTAGFPGSN